MRRIGPSRGRLSAGHCPGVGGLVMSLDRLPALPELALRWRGSVIEFPLHHMRGGTSTGLVIWERYAPTDRARREELLRHLMGLPLENERRGNRQITGLGRGAPTSNK